MFAIRLSVVNTRGFKDLHECLPQSQSVLMNSEPGCSSATLGSDASYTVEGKYYINVLAHKRAAENEI